MTRRDLLTLALSAATLRRSVRGAAQTNASVAQTPGVVFKDVTKQAGIEFKHVSGATGRKYLVETMGSGCAFVDYDSDGYLDIYLVNGAPLPGFKATGKISNALYRNNGDGTFTDVTQKAGVGGEGIYGMGVAVGDYDNDGYQDIYLSGFGRSILYHNNGDGTFTDVTQKAHVSNEGFWGASAAFLDYDNDGHLDLIVTNYLDYDIAHNVTCGYLSQGLISYCHPSQYNGLKSTLYHNNGDGTFTDVSEQSGIASVVGKGLGVAAADLDGDGRMDIYVANDTVANFLFHNNGDGTFKEVGVFAGVSYSVDGKARSGMGVDVGDYNGDGKPDIIVTNLSQEMAGLFRNDGDGLFTDVASQVGVGQASYLLSGWGTKFFDFDNDGDEDIFIANGHVMDDIHRYNDILTYREPCLLLENRGGRFANVTGGEKDLLIPRVSRGAAFGDYDNDGDIDILLANNNGPAVLLRNDGGKSNNWIKFKLVGTKSNRDGIGARLRLVAGELVQVKQIEGGGSYLSANDERVNFGLGKRKVVNSVEINWPSGVVQRLRNLKPNQIVVVKEP